jgi:hypothetical protein
LYRDALTYVAPKRDAFYVTIDGSEKGNPLEICDSAAQNALNKFVSNIQSSLVPPMKRWTKLVPGDRLDPELLDVVKPNLDVINSIMFSSIHNSNFDTVIAEAFEDLAIGTGALLVVKGANIETPLRFVCVPLNELYLEEGPYGELNTVFRKHQVEIRNIKGMWEDAKISEDLQKKIEEKPNQKDYFIECTYPSKIKINKPEQNEITGKTIMTTKQVDGFVYTVLHEETKQIIVTREQESSPWVIFRWSVSPGEIYGRGPVMTALPDIKSLNKTKELILRRASLEANPILTGVEDGLINWQNLSLAPGMIIPVAYNRNSMNGAPIEALELPGNFNVTQMVINDLITSINEIMFANPLGPIDLPVKTATEVAYRQQELAKRIGSAFGRLQYELITPLIKRILFVLNEWGLLPTFGEKVRVDGLLIGVKHESPLAAAQDQESVMAIQQFIQFLSGVFGPQMAMALVQPDKVVQHMAKYLNIPADIQLTQEQLTALKQKVEQLGALADQSMQNEVQKGGGFI